MGYQEKPELPGYWTYDGLPIHAPVEAHQFTVAWAKKNIASGARALDVGAGSGALTKQLLDAQFTMSCTSWDERITLPVDVYKLNLDYAFGEEQVGNRKYQLITCIEVIEHVENPAQLLRSLHSLLLPGGTLILSTPNVESAAARLQWLARGNPLIFGREEVVNNRHISMMWRQGLEFHITNSGFSIVERQFFGEQYMKPGVRRLIKKGLYKIMEKILSGDTHGEQRLYILKPADSAAKKTGPQDFY